MIFWPPAAAAATIMGFDVTMALPAAVTGEPGVLCTTITEGRFGVEGRNICEDKRMRNVDKNVNTSFSPRRPPFSKVCYRVLYPINFLSCKNLIIAALDAVG